MLKNNQKKEYGFTLVESLISITILMISVAAPLNLAWQGLVASDLAQRQIIALYLAQDAAEVILNIRTSNKLAFVPILTGLEDCRLGHGCAVETTNRAIDACQNLTCSREGILKIDSNNLYTHRMGADSPFTRFVKIENITPDQE